MPAQSPAYQKPSMFAGILKPIVVIGAIFLAGMYLKTMLGGGHAPTPVVFEAHSTLDDAFQTAGDGPVLALATADWCGPCQALKRGALADERFAQWLDANNVTTAYLDATGANADAQRLGISSIPTLVYFRDGKEVARTSGAMSTNRLLGWLDKANQF